MGLDNGICVKKTDFLSNNYKLKKMHHFSTSIELCYWRKCWNIRNLILDTLNIYSDNDLKYYLSIDEIDDIIKVLKKLNKSNWNDFGYSIWDWKEQKRHIKQHIKNLKYIKKLLNKYPNEKIDIYFYDSY